jgi:hypothetical protein
MKHRTIDNGEGRERVRSPEASRRGSNGHFAVHAGPIWGSVVELGSHGLGTHFGARNMNSVATTGSGANGMRLKLDWVF